MAFKLWYLVFYECVFLVLPVAEFCFIIDALRRFSGFEVDNKTISKKMAWVLCSIQISLLVGLVLTHVRWIPTIVSTIILYISFGASFSILAVLLHLIGVSMTQNNLGLWGDYLQL